MAIATSQQISKYYDLYRDKEVIFSKEMLHTLRIDPRQIYVKCNGAQWPCIINSTSFQMVKIIIGTNTDAFTEMTKKDGPAVQVRYCFIEANNAPLVFFTSGKVSAVTPYMNSQNLAIVTVTFTQRPPDDLILKLGSLIEANQNYARRKEDRIVITPNSIRMLGIEKEESIVFIQNVPRRCILRDISFTGAKVLLLGLSKFIIGKECILQIIFVDPEEVLEIKGSVLSAQPVEGRQDIASVSIKFDESQIPMNYKIHINNFLTSTRKTFLDNTQKQQAAPNPATLNKAQQQQLAAQREAMAQKELAARKAAAQQQAAAQAAQSAASPNAQPAQGANPDAQKSDTAANSNAPDAAADNQPSAADA